MKIIVGTYSKDTNSDGIYTFDFENGILKNKHTIQNKNNPSWLTIVKEKNLLIANEELDDCVSLTTYDLNTYEEKQSLVIKDCGFGSCHSVIYEDKLYVSNYSSGNFLVFEEDYEFVLSETQYVYNDLKKARCHEMVVNDDYIIALDLGLDLFIVYDKDFNDLHWISLEKEDGPRHGVFSKDGKYFYLLTELSNKLNTYDTENDFALISSLSSLDKDFIGKSYGAEIVLSENGKELYVSNRGEDSIAVFTLDNGIPIFKKRFSSLGKHPRSFTIKDNFIIIANKDSDNIVVIDLITGEKVSEVEVIQPTFVQVF